MRLLALAAALTLALPAFADDRLASVVDGHILPRFETLDTTAAALSAAARADCAPDTLKDAYNAAFDAWISVSHLRFGPMEDGDGAFALAYWPDPRGATPDALRKMILAEDPAVQDPAGFAQVSVAGRGLYALEYLLYDDEFRTLGTAPYRCDLIRAVATDIATNAATVRAAWEGGFAAALKDAGNNDRFRTYGEAMQPLVQAILGGLGQTAEVRLERPMGTFDEPRPTRAEVRRSGRSLRHVVLSLESTRDLAARIAPPGPVAEATDAAFARALKVAEGLKDPTLAGVADPQGRLRVEVLLNAVKAVIDTVNTRLGPALEVTPGFNAADGD